MALRRFVISGCSGGGKSSIIGELERRGQYVVPEAGRIIVRDQIASGGNALPWEDKQAFAEKLGLMALEQYGSVSAINGNIFFDRSFVEAEVFCDLNKLRQSEHFYHRMRSFRYTDPIFIVPPWEQIFEVDSERQHSFAQAVHEYDALRLKFLERGYSVRLIPKATITERADWISDIIDIQT